jgi:predicted RNase H-like HicB family nuclease
MKRYLVTDGKLVLKLEEDNEGDYVVTHPFDPAVTTQAKTISEAFENARDAMAELKAFRRGLRRKLPLASRSRLRKSKA